MQTILGAGGAIGGDLARRKSGQWLLSADHRHSFTYTPDAALGTALLGNAEDTWGQVWHLPTTAYAPSSRQITRRAESRRIRPPSRGSHRSS